MEHLPSRRPLRPLWRWLLILAGWLCVALAAAGVVLPLLPTTPFLLLAAACFSRSSERFYRWLLDNRLFGPMILQWQKTRSVSLRTKRVAQGMIVLTFTSTCVWFVSNNFVRTGLVILGLTILIHISRLRVGDPVELATSRSRETVDGASDKPVPAISRSRSSEADKATPGLQTDSRL